MLLQRAATAFWFVSRYADKLHIDGMREADGASAVRFYQVFTFFFS